MRQVDIYITAGIRGPARGDARVMYLMRTKRNDGSDHESLPSVAGYAGVTEARLVLLALRDALQRMRYACRIVIHTESAYIASAVNNRWMEAWERHGWKNARGKEVRDSTLWSQVCQLTDEAGHELCAECGSHEYSHWMRFQMPLADAKEDIFSEVRECSPGLVHDRVDWETGACK